MPGPRERAARRARAREGEPSGRAFPGEPRAREGEPSGRALPGETAPARAARASRQASSRKGRRAPGRAFPGESRAREGEPPGEPFPAIFRGHMAAATNVKTTVEELPESRVRVAAEVAPQEVQRRITEAAGKLGRDLRMPGF